MLNALTVPSATAAVSAAGTAGQAGGPGGTPVVQVKPVTPSSVGASSVGPNPSLQLDPALGLVVIEFRNDAGAVTESIPSQRQLQAYQRWAATHFGPAPSGMPGARRPTAPAEAAQAGGEAVSTQATRPGTSRH